jgi:branched-chain amino acid transport system permease protein
MPIATSETLQFAVDGFINGTFYGLIGLSFGLIVAVTQRFHFAWAVAFAITGYFTAYLINHNGYAPVPAAAIGLAGAALFSVLLELFVYRPVAARARANALLAVFVASFGATIAGQALIQLIVNQRISSEPLNWIPIDSHEIGGVAFTTVDVWAVAVFWACAVLTWALLRFSPLGREIQAVRVNPQMARAVGIRTERTYIVVFVLGSLLGGIAALFYAMDNAASADMGTTPVFYAFVVAFLAGLGTSPLWIMSVGTGLGVVEGLSAEVFSPQWQTVVVFGILLGLLVIKAAHAWRPTLVRLPALLAR